MEYIEVVPTKKYSIQAKIKAKTQKAKINVKYVSTIAALFTLSALVWNKVKDVNKNVDEKYQIEQQMQIPKENEITKYDNFQIVIENPTILDEKTQENKIKQQMKIVSFNQSHLKSFKVMKCNLEKNARIIW